MDYRGSPAAGNTWCRIQCRARDNSARHAQSAAQMGIFTDLSDDFTVQRLRPPYGDSMTTGEEQSFMDQLTTRTHGCGNHEAAARHQPWSLCAS